MLCNLHKGQRLRDLVRPEERSERSERSGRVGAAERTGGPSAARAGGRQREHMFVELMVDAAAHG